MGLHGEKYRIIVLFCGKITLITFNYLAKFSSCLFSANPGLKPLSPDHYLFNYFLMFVYNLFQSLIISAIKPTTGLWHDIFSVLLIRDEPINRYGR